MQSEVRARAERAYEQIADLVRQPVALMEVCGTHTMAISRFGIRARIPRDLKLLSGPGCPVCVTPTSAIDQLIAMSREPAVVVATFGDMMRVPGSESSLERERAAGHDIRIVYSPLDAMQLAERITDKVVVFMGVGFETTSPTVAATLVRAADRNLQNFCVLPAFKVVPPAMAALLAPGGARIDGFICPGHVSSIIGTAPYEPLASQYNTPCVVTGFEALDVLDGVIMLLEQRKADKPQVQVQYRRAVPREGNPAAMALLGRVFRPCDAMWRGIGVIPGTGLDLSEEFSSFDARRRIPIQAAPESPDLPAGCDCGEVMRGLRTPPECRLFGKGCTPWRPVGPCMVSTEGACAAYYRYGNSDSQTGS
jgi:hydrogenase expression/formation protein HypD